MSGHSLLYDLVNKYLMVLTSSRDVCAGKLTDLPETLAHRFVSQIGVMHKLLKERRIPSFDSERRN